SLLKRFSATLGRGSDHRQRVSAESFERFITHLRTGTGMLAPMRLWSLHPALLDRAALVACWREGLLAQAVLAGRTRGYRNHPQLERFRASPDPLVAVATYLSGVAGEADARGYRFDRTRLDADPDAILRLAVTR